MPWLCITSILVCVHCFCSLKMIQVDQYLCCMSSVCNLSCVRLICLQQLLHVCQELLEYIAWKLNVILLTIFNCSILIASVLFIKYFAKGNAFSHVHPMICSLFYNSATNFISGEWTFFKGVKEHLNLCYNGTCLIQSPMGQLVNRDRGGCSTGYLYCVPILHCTFS